MPGEAVKAARISRPSSVRVGMFCRLGLTEERRPVAVAAAWKVVCTRECRIGQQRQSVDVVRLEFREVAIFKNQLRDFVLLGELFEHVLRGGEVFAFAAAGWRGQAQVREQDFAELLGRVDVEAAAGKLEDAFADAFDLRR